MALTFGNKNSASGTSAAPTVTAPAGSSGDLLIVAIAFNDGTKTIADNNGATPCTEDLDFDIFSGGAGGGRMAVYHRVIGGSEPASYAFTLSASDRWAISSFLINGQHADIWDVAPVTTGVNTVLPGTSVNSAGITTLNDGALVIACATQDTSAPDFTAPGIQTGGWTEIHTIDAGQPLATAYMIKASAGATGNAAFGADTSKNMAALKQFSIKPAVTTVVKDLIMAGFIPFAR